MTSYIKYVPLKNSQATSNYVPSKKSQATSNHVLTREKGLQQYKKELLEALRHCSRLKSSGAFLDCEMIKIMKMSESNFSLKQDS